MSKASTQNYDNAVNKYQELASKYLGSDNLKKQYDEASTVASKNSQKVQQDKYNTYLSQGMNPAKASRLASEDASNTYEQDKNSLVTSLYNADKDAITAQDTVIQNAQKQDQTENENKGRILSTVGGVASGVASALSDERLKDIESTDSKRESDDFEYYMNLLED